MNPARALSSSVLPALAENPAETPAASMPQLERRCFRDPVANAVDAAHENRVLTLLLAQDGSTTRLCETLAGGPITLLLTRQEVTDRVPAAVRDVLPGTQFIE